MSSPASTIPSRLAARTGPRTIGRSGRITALYASAIFLGAFLLFQVEPIMGKLILPWFGGSAAVWTVTVLFFQLVLVLGYLYAHLLVRCLAPRRQAVVHVVALLASLLVLPILPSASWKPTGAQDPTLRILGLLAVTVGPPFLILSTCGPLMQAWYARNEGRPPYRLFSLSNAASLAGLLSYPLLVEPHLGTHTQAYVWSGAYALFVALAIVITRRAARSRTADAESGAARRSDSRPHWVTQLLWLSLAAVPSLLFLAVTNHLTRNVAPIPLLWVLPLAIYLLSLILCFEGSGYNRRLFLGLLPFCLVLMAQNLFPGELSVGIIGQITFFCGTLLICCMVCHGELARLKPAPEHLTSFYLMVAVGGALGGVFVAVIAPQIFSDYFELGLGVVLCAATALAAVAPGLLRNSARQRSLRAAVALAAAASTVILGLYVLEKSASYDSGDLLVARNFYGALSVRQSGSGTSRIRLFYSGSIVHGEQQLAPAHRREPTSYFGHSSGLGVLLGIENANPAPLRVGVVGLGVGTIASYGRPGDTYRFYEIDPNDIQVAKTQFSYLRESRAHTQVIPGDGRLSLEREPDHAFNVVVADAFAGDSVPVHLLTIQAFRLYSRLLAPGGVLAVNVSNRFLDLAPVIARAAGALGKTPVLIENAGENGEIILKRSEWVILAPSQRFAEHLAQAGHGQIVHPDGGRLWTDDYSNVLEALK